MLGFELACIKGGANWVHSLDICLPKGNPPPVPCDNRADLPMSEDYSETVHCDTGFNVVHIQGKISRSFLDFTDGIISGEGLDECIYTAGSEVLFIDTTYPAIILIIGETLQNKKNAQGRHEDKSQEVVYVVEPS